MEGLNERVKGLRDADNSVAVAGRKGSISRLNGNGKNIIKIIYF